MTPPRAAAFADLERSPLAGRALSPTPYGAIARSTKHFPDRPTLTFLSSGEPGGQALTLTYRQFLKEINRAANALHDLGVQPDDVVTLLPPNGPEYVPLLWGAQVAGVVNPVNPLLEAEHVAGLMRSAGSKVLVTLAPQSELGLWEKALAIAGQVPSLQAILTVGPAADPSLTGSPIPAASLQDLTAAQPGTLTSEPSRDSQKVAALFHTGGTARPGGAGSLRRRLQPGDPDLMAARTSIPRPLLEGTP